MSATLTSPVSQPVPAPSPDHARALREKMLAVGWSPDDITLVQGALTAARLHDTYLSAGYSPDEIEQLASLY